MKRARTYHCGSLEERIQVEKAIESRGNPFTTTKVEGDFQPWLITERLPRTVPEEATP